MAASSTPMESSTLLFTLHNKVNAKLGKVGGPDLASVQSLHSSYRAAGLSPVSDADLCLMLFVFGACADALPTPSTECTRRRKSFRKMALALAALCRYAGTTKSLHDLGLALRKAFQPPFNLHNNADTVCARLTAATQVPASTLLKVAKEAVTAGAAAGLSR